MPNASLTIDGTEVIKKENGVVSLKNTNADTSLSFPANHAGIKTALNASGDAPIYACRAWINFNGTSTVAIRASGNVSSITDNGGTGGDYTINFATAMPDANYAVCGTASRPDNTSSHQPRIVCLNAATPPTSSGARVNVDYSTGFTGYDATYVTVAIFR